MLRDSVQQFRTAVSKLENEYKKCHVVTCQSSGFIFQAHFAGNENESQSFQNSSLGIFVELHQRARKNPQGRNSGLRKILDVMFNLTVLSSPDLAMIQRVLYGSLVQIADNSLSSHCPTLSPPASSVSFTPVPH